MTKYREILRLYSLKFSKRNIALSVPCSRNTVSKVLKRAEELNISWPLPEGTTDADLEKQLFSSPTLVSQKRMPDFDHIRKELLKNGVTKKLLWTEYMADCKQAGEDPLMYSQFCYHIQQDESKRRATMHINRKPGEQVEVDWAGDTAKLVDPYTGETTEAYIFVGVMTYSQYAYVEAFPDEKQQSWIEAHVHMYNYFGGVAKILVPDNCKTAVVHNKGWNDQKINAVYIAEEHADFTIKLRSNGETIEVKSKSKEIAAAVARINELLYIIGLSDDEKTSIKKNGKTVNKDDYIQKMPQLTIPVPERGQNDGMQPGRSLNDSRNKTEDIDWW